MFILIYTYHLYLFTDFMTDVKLREIIGKVLVGISSSNIAINLGLLSLTTALLFVRNLKLFFLKIKRNQALSQRDEQRM